MDETDYEIIRTIDRPYQTVQEKIETAALGDVVAAFAKNADRALASPILTAGLFYSIHMELILSGAIKSVGISSARPKPLSVPGGQSVFSGVEDRLLARAVIGDRQEIRDGLTSILPSLVIASWTAFEVLASDLWLAVYESLPNEFRVLTGHEGRIDSQIELSGIPRKPLKPSGLKPVKPIPLGLSGKDALAKAKLTFASLTKIRIAYSRLFSEQFQFEETKAIDTVLCANRLDAVSLTRNVLVHKSGIADPVYLDRIKGVPTAPVAELGSPIVLNGIMTKVLVDSVVTLGSQLAKAADLWVQTAKAAKE